jgi:hypothetical protein
VVSDHAVLRHGWQQPRTRRRIACPRMASHASRDSRLRVCAVIVCFMAACFRGSFVGGVLDITQLTGRARQGHHPQVGAG